VMTKVTGAWPVVLADDDGIRPAGPPDACLYCRSAVGAAHGRECVTVNKLVRYRVYMNLDPGAADRGRAVGTYTRHDPHFWDGGDCEFHKNDSSWCAGNALDDIEWDDPADAAALDRWMADNGTDGCCCRPLSFEFEAVADAGPFVCRPGEEPPS